VQIWVVNSNSIKHSNHTVSLLDIVNIDLDLMKVKQYDNTISCYATFFYHLNHYKIKFKKLGSHSIMWKHKRVRMVSTSTMKEICTSTLTEWFVRSICSRHKSRDNVAKCIDWQMHVTIGRILIDGFPLSVATLNHSWCNLFTKHRPKMSTLQNVEMTYKEDWHIRIRDG